MSSEIDTILYRYFDTGHPIVQTVHCFRREQPSNKTSFFEEMFLVSNKRCVFRHFVSLLCFCVKI
jgi:hypothetical protein